MKPHHKILLFDFPNKKKYSAMAKEKGTERRKKITNNIYSLSPCQIDEQQQEE
jgi:hypothetical protein